MEATITELKYGYITYNKRLYIVTVGNTAKGEESPTRPPVNEAFGAWILNPSFTSKNPRILSNII